MAFGFGNLGTVTFGSWSGLTTSSVQQVTGPGWTAAVGDITPINQADERLRLKVVSARHNQQPVTVSYFMDPADLAIGASPPSSGSTASGTLILTYPPAEVFSTAAGMTAFKYGDMLDDEVMVGECEFMIIGGAALVDVFTP